MAWRRGRRGLAEEVGQDVAGARAGRSAAAAAGLCSVLCVCVDKIRIGLVNRVGVNCLAQTQINTRSSSVRINYNTRSKLGYYCIVSRVCVCVLIWNTKRIMWIL